MTPPDDRAQISDLFARYYTAVDTHDVEGWLSLWTQDGDFDSGHVKAKGTGELRAFISAHAPQTRHLVTNVAVDLAGDRATASTYMLVLPTTGTPLPIATAHCRSELVRIGQGWKLSRHTYRPDPSFLPPGAGAAVTNQVSPGTPDEAQRNKDTLRLLTLELWERRDESAIDRFFAPDYVQHSEDARPGRDGVRGFFRAMTRAFPDLKVTLDHLYAEGDRVFAFMTWTGTHREPLFDLPATHQVTTLKTAEIHRLRAGQIVEHWDVVSAPKTAPGR